MKLLFCATRSIFSSATLWVKLLAACIASLLGIQCSAALRSSPDLTIHSRQGEALMLEYSIDSSRYPVLKRTDARIRIASPNIYSQARLDRLKALDGAGMIATPLPDGQIQVAITTTEAIRVPVFDLLLSVLSTDPERGSAVETLLTELVVALPEQAPQSAPTAFAMTAPQILTQATPPPPPPPRTGKRHTSGMSRRDIMEAPLNPVMLPTADIPVALESKALSALGAWALAWQTGDSAAYFAAYAPDFRPPREVSSESWRVERTEKLEKQKQIDIQIRSIRFLPETSKVVVRFHQCFFAKNYQSAAIKEVTFRGNEDELLIIEEKIIAEHAAGARKRNRPPKRNAVISVLC